jgi:hypothetical protein
VRLGRLGERLPLRLVRARGARERLVACRLRRALQRALLRVGRAIANLLDPRGARRVVLRERRRTRG